MLTLPQVYHEKKLNLSAQIFVLFAKDVAKIPVRKDQLRAVAFKNCLFLQNFYLFLQQRNFAFLRKWKKGISVLPLSPAPYKSSVAPDSTQFAPISWRRKADCRTWVKLLVSNI